MCSSSMRFFEVIFCLVAATAVSAAPQAAKACQPQGFDTYSNCKGLCFSKDCHTQSDGKFHCCNF